MSAANLVKRVSAYALTLYPSAGQILKLAGSTAASQILWLAATPLLTRLYTPGDFGNLAAVMAIVSLLNVASSLRFELAIPTPEEDSDAIALVWLAATLVVFSTLTTAIVLIQYSPQLETLLTDSGTISIAWLIPFGVFSIGLYQVLNYWAIRKKRYGLLGCTKTSQSVLGIMTSVAMAPFGSPGLIVGQILGQSGGILSLITDSTGLWRSNRNPAPGILATAVKYKGFPLYSLPAGFINAIGVNFPQLIFTTAFGPEYLGLLALAQRILCAPANVIGRSVGEVLLGEASERHRRGELLALASTTMRYLALCGLLISTVISLLAVLYLPRAFGPKWGEAAWMVPLLAPLVISQLMVAPISASFVAAQKNREGLLAQVILMALRLAPLFVAVFVCHASFSTALCIYSCASTAGYVAYAAVLMRALANNEVQNYPQIT